MYANRYYALEVSYFKSVLDSNLLELLWSKYWVNALSANPLVKWSPTCVPACVPACVHVCACVCTFRCVCVCLYACCGGVLCCPHLLTQSAQSSTRSYMTSSLKDLTVRCEGVESGLAHSGRQVRRCVCVCVCVCVLCASFDRNQLHCTGFLQREEEGGFAVD